MAKTSTRTLNERAKKLVAQLSTNTMSLSRQDYVAIAKNVEQKVKAESRGLT